MEPLPPSFSGRAIERLLKPRSIAVVGASPRGFRGSPALDIIAVARIIARIAAVLRAQPSIREIDLNPVILYPEGESAIALDALVVID